MSDFLDTFVADAAADDKKKKEDTITRVDPIRYITDDDPDVSIVIGRPYTAGQIRSFKTFLSKHFDSFQIVSAIDHDKDVTSNITRYYRDNGIDITQYVKAGSKVLTTGRGMYAFTRSSDLDVKSFYDDTFNKTWFYAPITESYVFPVDTMVDWLFADNFQRHFAKKQLEYLKAFVPSKASLDYDEPVLKTVRSPNQFLQKWIGVETEIAWDLETKGLNPWAQDGRIICLTLTFDGKTGYYLPFEQIDIDILTEFFRGKKNIGSNLKFDVKWLATRGVDRDVLDVWGDTQHLGHLLNEMRPNGLKSQTWIYTTLGGYDEELDRYQEQYKKAAEDYSLIPTTILRKYATTDPIASYRIYKQQEKQLAWIDKHYPVTEVSWLSYSTWSLTRLYREIIVPAINTFVDIEIEGIAIDIDKLRETSAFLHKKLYELKQTILYELGATEEDIDLDEAAGSEISAIDDAFGFALIQDNDSNAAGFNIGSNEQLGKWLEGLGWPKVERSKKGHYKTNDKILHWWASKGYRAAELLLEYRGLTTLMKTFVGYEAEGSGFFQYINSDGKVHATFGVAMADSLRATCKSPNLQNLPKHSEFAQKIREFFIPPSDDYVISESDGAGLQLALEAQLTGDEKMQYTFTDLGGDMHSMSAQEIYRPDLTLEEFLRLKKEGDKEIKEVRFAAKAVNFSLIFHTTANSFARNSLEGSWTLEQAKEYIEKFELQDYLDKRRVSTKNIKRRELKKNSLSGAEAAEAEEFAHYWACADYIVEKFMKTYPGVAEHIQRSIEFAKKHGYIRSPFGSIRRLPQLAYEGEDDLPGIRKNLMNISVNSPIQTMEAVRIYHAMSETRRKIKEKGMRSRLAGMVHDSMLSFKHRDEVIAVSQFEKEAFEEFWPENRGVPLTLEVEIADPKKGQYWGFGEEIDVPKPKVKRKRRKPVDV